MLYALSMESKRNSLLQVAADLHAWRLYATGILEYPVVVASLLPVESVHAEASVAIFRNAAMAQHHVGYLRWACTHLRLSLSWDSEALNLGHDQGRQEAP